MSIKHTEDFKQEAVRIALTSGLPRRRVASDLGVGFSTLSKWVSQYRPTDLSAAPQADLARENERLRLENRILKEERDILKNCPRLSPPVCDRNGLWYACFRRVAAVRLLVA
jgi:transposase